MAGTWSETLDRVRRRLEELADAMAEALGARPERVPVPVQPRRPRR